MCNEPEVVQPGEAAVCVFTGDGVLSLRCRKKRAAWDFGRHRGVEDRPDGLAGDRRGERAQSSLEPESGGGGDEGGDGRLLGWPFLK